MKRIAEKMFEFNIIRCVQQARHQSKPGQTRHGSHLEEAEVGENIAEHVAQPGVL